MSGQVKAIIDKILAAASAVECCLVVPAPDGPFNIHLEAKSHVWLASVFKERKALEDALGYWGDWVENDGTAIQLRAAAVQDSVNNIKETSGHLMRTGTVIQSDVKDSILGTEAVNARSWTIGTRLKRQVQRHPLFVAVAIILTLSLLTSIVWSIAFKDPQTGFTIGGFLVAAGSIALAVLKWRKKDRKVALK